MMLTTEERKTLSEEGIVEGHKLVGEYKIYLEWENGYQTIRFRVLERTDGKFEFEQSHYIKTPEQASHYTTSIPYADTIDHALSRAVRTITDYYNPAREHGLKPSKSWFVPNGDF